MREGLVYPLNTIVLRIYYTIFIKICQGESKKNIAENVNVDNNLLIKNARLIDTDETAEPPYAP